MPETTRNPIGEHEPISTGMESGSVDQSPEDRKIVQKVMKMFECAKKARSNYDEKWMDYYRMFRGKQWFEQRPSYRHSEVINLIFKQIQATVPIQLDARPRIDFIPTDPSDREFAQIMSEVVESDWERYNWANELLEIIYDGNFYGTSFGSMNYDQSADYGAGQIIFQSEDPFDMYPDPSARDVNHHCKYFIKATPTDVDEVQRMYPDKKDAIKPDLYDIKTFDKTDLQNTRFKSPVDRNMVLDSSHGGNASSQNKTLLIKAYWHDDEMEDVEVEGDGSVDEFGAPVKVFEKKLKYAKIRCAVISSGTLLELKEFPYEHNEFPFARYVNYTLPREFWGISEVEQLQSPQKVFNKLINFTLDVLTLAGNPLWIVNSASGVDTDNLFNRPGLVVEHDGSADMAPRRVEGAQLQPFVMQIIDRMASWFDEVAGTPEVSQGVAPSSITANAAIENLQEAGQTRLRQKMRNMDCFLKDMGRQWASLALQYYTVPRIYRITNQQGLEKYFKFHVEQGDDGKKVARVRQLGYAEGGIPVELGEKTYEIRAELDVRANTGSSLPFSKAEKEQKALQLFDRQVIDAEELLKVIDYPNREAVLARIAQVQEQAAAQQAQQGVA